MADDVSPFPGKSLGHGHYQLTDHELADAVIIRPGMINPEDPNHVRIEPEAITTNTVLKPLDIVLFYDSRSKRPLQEGVNEQAFVVNENRALYARGIVRSIALSKIRSKPEALVVRGVPEPIAPFVAKMLLRYRWRPTMFSFATNFIQMHNYAPFLWGDLFPPDVSYQSNEEFRAAWGNFISILEPHDFLLTFDRSSLLSKIIAVGTHGPFSHIASYIGEGMLWEVVTSGTRIVPLETYQDRRYRVAAYRNYGHSFVTNDEAMAHYKRTAGLPGYNYFGAFGAGVKTFFGDKHGSPTSPNGIVLSGSLTFIDQV